MYDQKTKQLNFSSLLFVLATRSRGSITMRMLMGANGIYADGKAQPMASNGNVFFF
jgi:TfoX/Sxy family transcriptional regulator of competence genes